MKNRLLMNKQLISFQNQRQPVSKTSSATVDLGEMVLISREKKMHTTQEHLPRKFDAKIYHSWIYTQVCLLRQIYFIYGIHIWASLVSQMGKNWPAMWETWVQSLAWEDPLEEGMATHSSILAWRTSMDKGAWKATVNGVAKSRTQLSN